MKNYGRYGLWLSVVQTAWANQRHFGLTTAWLPHLLGNSLTLWLPEIYKAAKRLFARRRRPASRRPTLAALQTSFEQLVLENPDYVDYVAPAALGYILSHPRFNIYQGEWGRWNILGFHLDTIPHAATAYAFANLAQDSLVSLQQHTPQPAALRPWVERLARRKALVAGGFIILLTLVYEVGEYLIHCSELKARDHDPKRINMMWSVEDTVFDTLSNMLGWALSTWRHRRSGSDRT